MSEEYNHCMTCGRAIRIGQNDKHDDYQICGKCRKERWKLKCQSCQEDREEYLNGLCKKCSDKMDNYLLRRKKK